MAWRPINDLSGGLIVFDACDETTAQKAVRDDPFLHAGLLERWWLKQWDASSVSHSTETLPSRNIA